MMHYGGATPKRHMLLGNSHLLGLFDKGRLSKNKWREAKAHGAPRTAKRYTDAEGRRRWSGTSYLKKTQ